MRIVHVSSAFAPFLDSDHPRAEPVAALAKALVLRGHEVVAVLPMLEGVDPLALGLARRLRPVKVSVSGEEQALVAYEGRTPGGVRLVLLDHEQWLRDVPSLGAGEGTAAARRTLLFARGAARWAQQADPPPDVLHGHGLLGALLLLASEGSPVAWTLYDPEERIGGPEGIEWLREALSLQEPSLTAAAMVEARHVALPSRALADALLEGASSQGVILHPIPGGLDEAVWNPVTDPLLEAHFDAVDLRGKRRGQAALRHRLELPTEREVPLLLADALRADQARPLAGALPAILHNEVQVLVLLGSDLPEDLSAPLHDVQRRFPERVRVLRGDEPRLVHRALAAADLRLLPERWAPGSGPARAAQRYGALPVASLRSAHAEAVVDCDPSLQSGTGFLFDPDEGEEALAACTQRATVAWHERDAFEALRARVMRIDASWQRAAVQYERLYERIGEPSVAAPDPA